MKVRNREYGEGYTLTIGDGPIVILFSSFKQDKVSVNLFVENYEGAETMLGSLYGKDKRDFLTAWNLHLNTIYEEKV